jgi:hypothetical protein
MANIWGVFIESINSLKNVPALGGKVEDEMRMK